MSLDLTLLDDLLSKARRLGATAADVTATESDAFTAGTRMREVETLKRSVERRLGIRLFAGARSAMASTSDVRPEALQALLEGTWALAKLTAEDPASGLPEGGPLPATSPEGLLDAAVGRLTTEEKTAMAAACEAASLSGDPRLVNSEGAECHTEVRRRLYADSRGFRGEYSGSSISVSASPVAREGDRMQIGEWWSATRSLRALQPPEEVGRKAAARALRKLGARKGRTCRVPVVFDPQTAGQLMQAVCGAVSGGAVYRRMSFLAGRLGQAVASPLVTVVDDPLLPGGLGSRPFDAEGTPSRRTLVIGKGVLESWLTDAYAARKLGLASTGNAARAPGEAVSVSPSNFFLEAGASSPESIVAGVTDGLYVTALMGFGVNSVTGDYSQGAAGLWIEGGKLAHPVEEITIAGNLLAMLASVDAVGTDLEHRAAVSAPTLRIPEMTVAGN